MSDTIQDKQDRGRAPPNEEKVDSGFFKPPKKKVSGKEIARSIINITIRIVVTIIGLLHYALIGYNCYINGLSWKWIVILYVYIIWSSLKYAGNYLNVSDGKFSKFLEKIFGPNENFQTQYMRSFIAIFYHLSLLRLN